MVAAHLKTSAGGSELIRALRLIEKGPVRLSSGARDGRILMERCGVGRISVDNGVCRQILSSGLGALKGDRLSILAAGRSRLRREKDGTPCFLSQHGEIETIRPLTATGASLRINLSESPLARLARMKSRHGTPFLNASEWEAGERLRVDFTRGQMQPRLGIDWDAPLVGTSGQAGDGGADMSDAAMAARIRVEQALAAAGPELSGVLLDICCFLKGLSQVERERGWPVRSAKIMLKAALATLARHYGGDRPKPATDRIVHWGSQGYRPSLGQPGQGG